MVLPKDQVPVGVVIEVRRRPTGGYACCECLSIGAGTGAGGGKELPFAATVLGAVRSWLFLLELGRDDVRPCLDPSPLLSERPSRELRRDEDGRATLLASKSRRATLARTPGLEVGGVSCAE